MNFDTLLHESSMNSDFQRLIQLCSSYGLNEQQTNQIIYDFKNGSFVQQDQSVDQSFHQSLRQMESNQCDDNQRSQHEQYSFKNQKNMTANFYQNNKHQTSHNDSLEQDSKRFQKAKNIVVNNQMLQCFINERRQFQKNIYAKMQQEVQNLKASLKQKQQKISALIKIKMQDSDIIMGLKDNLSKMTSLVYQRQRAYKDLTQRYQKLKLQNESLSTQKNSKVQLSHQQSSASLQERKSVPKQKQNCLTQVDQNKAYKKSSQKYIKELTNRNTQNKTIQRITTQQSRQTIVKNDPTKRSGIDINKYKGMIQKLRNSYQFR